VTAALWTLYAVGVLAILVACYRQAARFDRAQRQLDAMRERYRQQQRTGR
jgi:hypothetical protein